MSNRAKLLVAGWLLIVLALILVCVLPLPAAAKVATEEPYVINIPPYPTYPSCPDGSPIGSWAGCPVYTTAGGPTPTANKYVATVTGETGRSYMVYRSWSYADVAQTGLLVALLLCFLAYWLTSSLKRR